MNTIIIENILRALVSALPDDYFKQELDRRGIAAAPKAEDQSLFDLVPEKDIKKFVKQNLHKLDTETLLQALELSDDDLWEIISDKTEVIVNNLSLLEDGDLWDAIDDKNQIILDNLCEVGDDDMLESLSDPEYAIAKWIGIADKYTVKKILDRVEDDVLVSAFSDKKSLAEQAVVDLSGDDMLDVLDCCGEVNTRQLLTNHLERQGELRFFLVSQSSTDLYEALKEKGDSPKLSAEDIIASAHACRFDVNTTLNIIRALLDTL